MSREVLHIILLMIIPLTITHSDVVYHKKLLEEKEMNSFLLEAHKKIVSSEIK